MAKEEKRLTDASVKQDGGYADGRAGGRGGTDREHFANEERRSREKEQLQALREKHDAEVNSNLAEVSAVFKRSSKESSDAGKKASHRAHGSQGDGSDCQQPRRSNAFSILLVRANTRVPTTRVDLGSGSWREAIGEMVGCPGGQKLSAVRIN